MSYIKFSNVSKIYKEGEYKFYALKNINLEFNKNEFVTIIGPSGCGKSTLLNLIARISKIDKGDILINNKSIKNFNKKELNSYLNNEIGIIFQKYNLINMYNVIENIELVRNKDINENESFILLNELDLQGLINKNIDEISGGEAQRIAAIRSIINKPTILLLDEPTGALDEENGKRLLNYILSIKSNKLIIMVTHNLELAKKYSTRIIELKDGRVIRDTKNIQNIVKEVIYEEESHHFLSFKYILKYIKNLIIRKKGRLLISIICTIFLLFFLSISTMGINVVNNYVNLAFLSSLDANVVDLKSYNLLDKELKEIDIPTIILKQIKDEKDYIIRKNFNKYLDFNLLNKLTFRNVDKNINLNGVKLCCMSCYHQENLKYGEFPKGPDEVIINENLYNYLKINNIINKRFEVKNSRNNLKIVGVSHSSLMNDSLIIFFDYNLISDYLENIKINDYQIDVKDIKKIDKIVEILKENKLYKEKSQINTNDYNYSLEYSEDLENYYTFYELIKVSKLVIYLFLSIATFISIILFSNVLYSFNEEEKKNLAILKVLGFSNINIGMINLFLSSIISIISFIIIIFINNFISIYFTPILNQFLNLNNKINISLSFSNYCIMSSIILLISFISSIYPLIKINNLEIDNVLKEE